MFCNHIMYFIFWKHRKLIVVSLAVSTAVWISLGLRILWLNDTEEISLHVRRFVSDAWTHVHGSNDTYVFNAYFTGRDKFVRVLGIGPTELKDKVHCVFICSDDMHTKKFKVAGKIVQMIDSHGLKHNNIEVLCNMPAECRPDALAVTNEEGSDNLYLKIHYPPEKNLKTKLFSVCTPAIHSNFKQFTEIVQSFEIDAILGAESFTLYYQSAVPEVDAVLRMYIDSGNLTVIPWNVPPVNVHYFGQVSSIRDCFYRNMHTSRYIVFKDFDEVLLPYRHKDWNSLINDLLRDDRNIAGFIFRNSFVYKGGSDVTHGISQEIYKTARSFELYTIFKQYRQTRIWPGNYRSKFIVDPEGVDNVEIHMIKAIRKGFKTVVVNDTLGLMFHYKRFVDHEIPRVKDSAMLRFKDTIIERVNRVYEKLNKHYSYPKPLFPNTS